MIIKIDNMRQFTEKLTVMFEKGEIPKWKKLAEAKGYGNLSNYIRTLLERDNRTIVKIKD